MLIDRSECHASLCPVDWLVIVDNQLVTTDHTNNWLIDHRPSDISALLVDRLIDWWTSWMIYRRNDQIIHSVKLCTWLIGCAESMDPLIDCRSYRPNSIATQPNNSNSHWLLEIFIECRIGWWLIDRLIDFKQWCIDWLLDLPVDWLVDPKTVSRSST